MNNRQQILERLRQQSIQNRSHALIEQEKNRSAISPPITAAGASSSGGGSLGCLPLGGLMMTTVPLSIGPPSDKIIKIFLSEVGTENGETVYASSFQTIFGFNWLKVSFNSDNNNWEFSTIAPNFLGKEKVEGYQQTLIATSTELFNDEWETERPGDEFGSSPGGEFNCNWRYCITFPNITTTAQPMWDEIPLSEPPNKYVPTPGIFWSPENSSWIYTILKPGGPIDIELGGTRTDLPIGTFDIGEGEVITINEGVCDVEPLPPLEDIELSGGLGGGDLGGADLGGGDLGGGDLGGGDYEGGRL